MYVCVHERKTLLEEVGTSGRVLRRERANRGRALSQCYNASSSTAHHLLAEKRWREMGFTTFRTAVREFLKCRGLSFLKTNNQRSKSCQTSVMIFEFLFFLLNFQNQTRWTFPFGRSRKSKQKIKNILLPS